MKHVTTKLAALVVAGLSVGMWQSASAADLPVKAAPPVLAPAFTWTGFYIGGHAGAGWKSNDHASFTDPNGIINAAHPITFSGGNSAQFVGGFHAGYNWQFAPAWVIGIEGDFSWANLSNVHHASTLPFPVIPQSPS